MKRSAGSALVSAVLVVAGVLGTVRIEGPLSRSTSEGVSAEVSFSQLPLHFIPNRGQAPGYINYYLQGAQTSVGFSTEGLVLSFAGDNQAARPWHLGLEFLGARRTPPIGRAKTAALVSYLKGTPEQWVTGLPTFARVTYRDLWPGIDLVYSGTGSRLKYSFLLEPGADPAQIKLVWQGANDLRLDAGGRLIVAAPGGAVVDGAPSTYQRVSGERVVVSSRYVVHGDSYGFRVGAYDPERPLVIDPEMLVYAGYIGGAGEDGALDIAVDEDGAAYVVGQTESAETTFPDGDGFGALGGPDRSYNGPSQEPESSLDSGDAFIAKVNPSGTALVFVGYIGGSSTDIAHGVAVDGAGAAYVAGTTGSDGASFPDGDGFGAVTGPDLTHNGGWDAFVAKVRPSGTSLDYAGYIGGGDADFGNAIAVDATGAAYVTGTTYAGPYGGFPVLIGPDTTRNGGHDAFVAKVDSSGSSLVYAGYIGGSGSGNPHLEGQFGGFGIAVDGAGAAYVAGTTDSDEASFPDGDGFGSLPGPDNTYNGGRLVGDAFMAKVNPSGASLAYAGYIGGSGDEGFFGVDVVVELAGAAYVTGDTTSSEATFPDGDGFGALGGPDTTHNGDHDAFVAKVNPTGSLTYVGFIGGAGRDAGRAIAVDAAGAAHVTGSTGSDQASFPDGDGFGSLGGHDTTYNGGHLDAFVAKVNPSGTSLAYAGYIGGKAAELASGVGIDRSGGAYVAGYTASSITFPDGDGFGGLKGPDTTHNGGDLDGFVVKIGAGGGTCRGRAASHVGTSGRDVLKGTGAADVIVARGGNDSVKGRGGRDIVCAGGGKDRINGGSGKDTLVGGAGKDDLKGAGGNDRLNGGPGRDVCNGGPGRDRASACETSRAVP